MCPLNTIEKKKEPNNDDVKRIHYNRCDYRELMKFRVHATDQ